MARRLSRLLRIALPVLWTAASAPAQARGVVEISDGAGLVGPQVTALSADGSLAAGYDLYAKGFRWDGTLSPVPALPGGSASFVMGLSGDGQTAVGSATATTGPPYPDPQYPVRWTASEGTVSLGSSEGAASGASYDGSVIVGWIGNASPFRWTAESGMQGLGLSDGVARDVSADGGVVVGDSASAVAGYAFRWTPAAGAESLLQGSPFVIGSAFAVSADGTTVVGGVGDGQVAPAYRWTAAEGLVVLGAPPGCDGASRATAVSGDGRLIVGECFLSDGVTRRPFVWSDRTGMLSLDAFLALRGITLPRPLVDPEITAVSDDGRVIAIVDVLPDATLSYLVDLTPAVPALAPWLNAALAASLAGVARARLVKPGVAARGARA